MKHTAMIIGSLSLGMMLICIASAGCTVGPEDPPPVSEPGLHLWLAASGTVEADEPIRVSLNYHRDSEQPGPRLMELFLRVSPSLEFASSTKGKATLEAGKELVVQAIAPDKLRVVLYSGQNLATLDSGTLASLSFKKAQAGRATVEILTEKPIFAPAEANQGLLVSDPLIIELR